MLIDDPPVPSNAAHAQLLDAARALPRQIQELLAAPAVDAREALDAFHARTDYADISVDDMYVLAAAYSRAVRWLEDLAVALPIIDHSDQFFAEHVVGRLALELGSIAEAVRQAVDAGDVLPRERIAQLYRSLVWTSNVVSDRSSASGTRRCRTSRTRR